MSNWIKVKLGDIIELKRESYHPKPDEVLPYIGLEHIGQGTLRLISVGKSNEVTSTKSYFSKGDILFGKLRPYFRKVVRPKFNGVCSTDILVLTSKNPRKFNQTFLFYLMASKEMIDLATASSSGTKMPRADWKMLQNLEISIPEDVNEQERIGKILETIDDKIDINIRMNKTLEEMAMTLYKHWFVDFGPFQDGEFVESELGMIPKGWKVSSLKEFANILMGQSPKSEFYNRERKGLPFHQGVKDFGIRYPVHTVYCTQELRVAKKGDILLSVRAPVGRINIANSKLVIGRGLSALNSKSGHNSFLLYTLKRIFAFEDQYGSGTVFNSISKKDIEQLKFIRPSQEVLDNFEKHVSKFDSLIESNTKEIEELQGLRDYLLPRLLSGEIDVSQAEKQVEEVL